MRAFLKYLLSIRESCSASERLTGLVDGRKKKKPEQVRIRIKMKKTSVILLVFFLHTILLATEYTVLLPNTEL